MIDSDVRGKLEKLDCELSRIHKEYIYEVGIQNGKRRASKNIQCLKKRSESASRKYMDALKMIFPLRMILYWFSN